MDLFVSSFAHTMLPWFTAALEEALKFCSANPLTLFFSFNVLLAVKLHNQFGDIHKGYYYLSSWEKQKGISWHMNILWNSNFSLP